MLKAITTLVILLAGISSSVQLLADEASTVTTPSVSELQQKRIEVLETQVRAEKALLKQSRTSESPVLMFGRLLDVKKELAEAKIEVASSPEEIATLLGELLEDAKESEQLVKLRRESPVAVIEATAARLEAEITLSKHLHRKNTQAVDGKLLELQKQRLALLSSLVRGTHALISLQRGDVDPALFSRLVEAKRRELEASLDLESDNGKQVELHKGFVNDLKAYEQRLRSRNESSVTCLEAEAMRLNAEIRLAKLQAKVTAQ